MRALTWICSGCGRRLKGVTAAAHVDARFEGRECPPMVRLPRVRAVLARLFGGAR